MIRRLLVLALCAGLVGCTIHSIRLDDYENVKIDETRPREISSQTCGFLVLFPFIPIQYKSHLLRAQKQLKYAANGGAITNVRMKESWYWLLVGNLLCTDLSATTYPRMP